MSAVSIIRTQTVKQMLKPNFDILKNQFGIDYDRAVQFHRSSERCMCHVKHNLERMIKKVQKQCKVKLTGFSYIRECDRLSHTTKVASVKTNRKFYICLMLGSILYLENFKPNNSFDDSVYAIEGLDSTVIPIPAPFLREIFKYIPFDAYDYKDDLCCIEKDVFLAGVREHAKRKPKKS